MNCLGCIGGCDKFVDIFVCVGIVLWYFCLGTSCW